MKKNCSTKIINCSQNNNALYIKLVNVSPTSNLVNLTVYDYTNNQTPIISYNKTLYLTPSSVKTVTLPLITDDYGDCLNIKAYKICCTNPSESIKLSYKELSIE